MIHLPVVNAITPYTFGQVILERRPNKTATICSLAFLTYFARSTFAYSCDQKTKVFESQQLWKSVMHLPGEDLSAHSPSQQGSDGLVGRRVRRLEYDDTHQKLVMRSD